MSEGSVGWAGARSQMASPVVDAVEFRFTCVLHLEHGEWKIVQWHSSIPSTNEEYGFFLTKSVDDIVNHTVGRVLDLFDIDAGLVKRWRGAQAGRVGHAAPRDEPE